MSFLREQKHRWRENVGGFTISTVLSEGIDTVGKSALAFNLGLAGTTRSLVEGAAKLALRSIVGAVRNGFSESVRSRSVAPLGSDMILGMPSIMLARVTIVMDENTKILVSFILWCCFG